MDEIRKELMELNKSEKAKIAILSQIADTLKEIQHILFDREM